MSILDKIIEYKEAEVVERSKVIPLERLKDSQRLFAVRDFKKSLSSDEIDIISEIKFKSPSLGVINETLVSPEEIATQYSKSGASAVSVLTDEEFFGGKLHYINDVKSTVDIPILRKDFIVTEYQLWESFYAGADAVLLIADAVPEGELTELYELANEIGLHVLLEFHHLKNAKIVAQINPPIVGVNCRNLQTMQTNIAWFEAAMEVLPESSIKVAESGIFNNSQLQFIESLGYDAALIGSSLMKTGNPGLALAQLLQRDPK